MRTIDRSDRKMECNNNNNIFLPVLVLVIRISSISITNTGIIQHTTHLPQPARYVIHKT
jgi:hypothetical protein